MQRLFTNDQVLALKTFNQICSELRGDYNRQHTGLLKLWETTLTIFHELSGPWLLKHLVGAFISIRPHWSKDFDKITSLREKAMFYFRRSANSLIMLPSPDYYSASVASYQGRSTSSPQTGFCLIHPDRRSRKDRPVCNSCYQKLLKLGLENYPLDFGLLRVLKMRVSKFNRPSFCVNHPKVLALGSGLCQECNKGLGILEDELEKHDLKVSLKFFMKDS